MVTRGYTYAEIFEPNFVPVNGQPPPEFVAILHDRAIRNDKFKLIERVAPTSTTYEFYQMFDPTPGAPPVPQNPAITPDPHELVDLMPLMETWPQVVQSAFLELTTELQTTYPALPVN